ncbi:unnamed protein product [Adineta ricciae]|uniref:Uncharacterized protein n=1 Tax=Adineta ricciae TaxID=249248 RepID=A0A815WZ00_ADIRI|nr:unnamed protein product [Adineta ricciae]
MNTMLDQQIESVSSKLVQFIQDLTVNIQTVCHKNVNFNQLFQLRSDYAKQMASLFDMLITQLIEEFLPNRTLQLTINLDPVQIWRSIQTCVDQLNALQWQDLSPIIKHIRTINNYFYNLLLQVKNAEFLRVDQTRSLYRNLSHELYCLSESLMQFSTIFYTQPSMVDETKLQESIKPIDTYLFQNNNHHHHLNQQRTNLSSNEKPMNSNCYSYNMPNYQTSSNWANTDRNCCVQSAPIRCDAASAPRTNTFPQQKPMGCGYGSQKTDIPPPLCFPTPVVYTPEMETLSSSGGIIYARKSGLDLYRNTWIAENLGTLIETLKEIGQTIDMNAHCEILVRKTGELLVRRKKGRRKHFIQENMRQNTSHGNNAYAEMNTKQEPSVSNASHDDH